MKDGGLDDLLLRMETSGTALPLQNRIADRLADLLWISDEIMEMIGTYPAGNEFEACGREVRAIYDATNALMKTMCD